MDNTYIGGNFASSDIIPFYIDASDIQLNSYFPNELNSLTRYFFETGADALSSILVGINTVNSKLWFPDNYCEETIQRVSLKTGITNIKKYLVLDDIKVESSVVNVIILVHFNGYCKDITDNINTLKHKTKAVIIEDYVHAPLEIALFTGDFAFNSLRKIANNEVAIAYKKGNITTSSSPSQYYQLKKEAEILKSEFLLSDSKELENQFLDLFSNAEKHLMNEGIWLANEKEIHTLYSIDLSKIRDVRRKNFMYLKEKLQFEKNIEIIRGDYLFLIIKCKQRDELRKHLFANRISAPIHWADSDSEISKHLLSLPIDQRYGLSDMNRLSSTIIQFYK